MNDIFLKSLEPKLAPDILQFCSNFVFNLEPHFQFFKLFRLLIKYFMMQYVNNSSMIENIEIWRISRTRSCYRK
jgi:hypothetical protein